tara:strand:+ start:3006 stop:3437 length:432 start_codon:yes stop_codon:yes gene_type:complete
MNCAICFEKLNKNTPKLTCGHSFHVKCLRKWYYIGKKSNCPLCRANIRVYPYTRSWKRHPDVCFTISKLLHLISGIYNPYNRIPYINIIFDLIWENRNFFREYEYFVKILNTKLDELNKDITSLNDTSNVQIFKKILKKFENF